MKKNGIYKRSRGSSLKGMDALISAVLLIAIVLIIAMVFSNWVTSFTKKQQARITNKTVDCTATVIGIEGIYIDLASNTSRVSVRNSGSVEDNIIDGAFLNTVGQDSSNLTAFPINFPPGRIEIIQFNISGKIASCANFSRAIISTECTSDDQSRPLTCS